MEQWRDYRDHGPCALLTACCLLLALAAIAIFLKGCAASGGSGSFREYASKFVVPEADGVPTLSSMPEDVYRDALAMKQEDYPQFIEAATQILMKYHRYYMRNFRQSYSFLSPDEIDSKAYLAEGNNRFFLLREFMCYYGVSPSRQDGMPSMVVEIVAKERGLGNAVSNGKKQ